MKRLAAALAITLTTVAFAEQPPGPPPWGPPPGQRIDLVQALSITPQQAADIEAILASAREAHRAVHERTRAELARVLTADQLARFDALRPRPRHGPGRRGGPPEGR